MFIDLGIEERLVCELGNGLTCELKFLLGLRSTLRHSKHTLALLVVAYEHEAVLINVLQIMGRG